MKKAIVLFIFIAVILLYGCAADNENSPVTSPGQVVNRLSEGNRAYVNGKQSGADISAARRGYTAQNGQEPYAVIITCSDSRVPPEHIFSAGIGDLFVIRTAGNVIGDFELGSIEYGVLHTGAKAVVVMGHSGCGAVYASYGDGAAEGHINDIINEIRPVIAGAADLTEAEDMNIAHSYDRVLESGILSDMTASGEIVIIKAKYDIETGAADFWD